MTNYGTIPTSSAPTGSAAAASPLGFISRAKERGQSALATRRPWREMAHRHAFSLPPSIGDAYLRIRTNLSYFAMNYAIVVLLIVFLSLINQPVALIVFIVMMAAWLFLYFLRDEPIVIAGRVIGDKVVLIVLSAVTLVMLLLTQATVNILTSVVVVVGLVLVVVHAVLRKTEDLSLDDESAAGWYAPVGTSSSS